MATLTVFADTADGTITSTAGTAAGMRAGAGLSVSTIGTSLTIGQEFDGANYNGHQTGLPFDTSALGAGAVISAAALSLWGVIDNSVTDFIANVYADDFGATLDTTDWRTTFGTVVATLNTSGFGAGFYSTFTESGSNLRAAVNKTGTTRLMVISNRLAAATNPTDAELITVRSANQTGTTNDPKLVITYTAPLVLAGKANAAMAMSGALTRLKLAAGKGVSAFTAAGALRVNRAAAGKASTASSAAGTLTVNHNYALAGVIKIAASGRGHLYLPTPGTRIWRPSADELLDGGIPRRIEGFRIDIVDHWGTPIGELPQRGDIMATVRWDTAGRIQRTLNNLAVRAADADDIDPDRDRLAPMMTVGGVDHPLGLFLWSSPTRRRHPWGRDLEGALGVDLSFILDQRIRQTAYLEPGELLRPFLIAQLEAAGLADYDIETSYERTATLVGWPAGTRRATVIDAILGRLGWVGYFNNAGRYIARRRPLVGLDAAARSYDDGRHGRIVTSSPTEVDDRWQRPNVWIAIGTGAAGEIIGVYELPDDAPGSRARRFYEHTAEPIEDPTIASTAQAVARARAAARAASAVTELVDFTARADPRHDGYEIVTYLGDDYLETAWELPLAAGADHAHALRREVVS